MDNFIFLLIGVCLSFGLVFLKEEVIHIMPCEKNIRHYERCHMIAVPIEELE